ncbi:MAG: iron-containing alcohol dehydrogenase [Candidatus Aureabacteria bacterium]|nr:iron-containing alcohol dehydrogenase [Candidatus Auribacterota bacterium]
MKEFINPVKIIDEIDSFYRLPGITLNVGAKVLIVHGKNFLYHYGHKEKVETIFNEQNIPYLFYAIKGFEADINDVMSCIEIIKKESIDVVVGIGGGSVIDVAKASSGICNEREPLKCFHEDITPISKGIPLITVPTTAGSGAEVTPNAVISDFDKNIKKSIRSDYMYPKYALLDARLTETAPQNVTAASGADALAQAIEAFVSIGSTEKTDELSKKAIQLIGKSLIDAYKRPMDLAARKNVLTGSNLAALAFSNSRLGAVHGMAHCIGVRYRISHGMVCAILLPVVMEHNLDSALEKYAEISYVLTNKTYSNKKEQAISGINYIRKLFRHMELDKKLSNFGATTEHIDEIIEKSLKSSSMKHNPRMFDKKDVIYVFERCL